MNYFGYEKKCPVCGKLFVFYDDWAYKSGPGDGATMFCSWSCLQAWRNGRGSKAERRDRIIQAVKDGLSVNEIAALLSVDKSTVAYWKNKLEGEKDNA